MEIQSALTQTLYAQLLEEATAYSVAIFEQASNALCVQGVVERRNSLFQCREF